MGIKVMENVVLQLSYGHLTILLIIKLDGVLKARIRPLEVEPHNALLFKPHYALF